MPAATLSSFGSARDLLRCVLSSVHGLFTIELDVWLTVSVFSRIVSDSITSTGSVVTVAASADFLGMAVTGWVLCQLACLTLVPDAPHGLTAQLMSEGTKHPDNDRNADDVGGMYCSVMFFTQITRMFC